MPTMPRPRDKYLHKFWTRHRKLIWYVRKPGGSRIRIKGEFGTPEFKAQYDAAIAGQTETPARARTASGSVKWLWERYKETDSWRRLKPATRRQRENIMVGVLVAIGEMPCAGVTKKDITASRDARSSTPAQARNFLDCMRGMFRWGLDAQHVKVDPTDGVKNPKRQKTDGFKAWDETDVAKYQKKWTAGTRERVWMHVLLYIGARRGDAVTLGKQHVKNGAITFVTEKGEDRIEVSRTLEPELVATLARGPTSDLAFICGERGAPLTKESFGNMFKAACVGAGIMDKSAHGLRKLSATIWAERGATEHELMAMFGWMTPQMAALYTRAARRKMLALNAHARLMGTPAEHPMCPPEGKVGTADEK